MTAVFVAITATSGAVLVLSAALLEAVGIDGVGLAWLIASSAAAAVLLVGDFRFVWRPARDEAGAPEPVAR